MLYSALLISFFASFALAKGGDDDHGKHSGSDDPVKVGSSGGASPTSNGGVWAVEIGGKNYTAGKFDQKDITNLGQLIKFRVSQSKVFTFTLFLITSYLFSVDYTLTGAPAPDRLVVAPTVIYTSKTPNFPSSSIINPTLKSLEIDGDTAVLVVTTSGGKYKIQCKDHPQGGVLQTEPEFAGLGVMNITHVLAPGIFYFVNPFTNKVNFGDGANAVTQAENSTGYHEMLFGKESTEAAINVVQTGNLSIWAVQPGGRMGSVFGEDAIETGGGSSNCTSQCQNQNQIHDTLSVPAVGVNPIA
ncbi:hypothetical protein DL96DRAFT_1713234 [Flagelloscypha sp. PMI_526]|nr:hypothetical protein DL96DRAFT_1713234 [Flagelloscypha sp. PMI_526]